MRDPFDPKGVEGAEDKMLVLGQKYSALEKQLVERCEKVLEDCDQLDALRDEGRSLGLAQFRNGMNFILPRLKQMRGALQGISDKFRGKKQW